MSSFNNLIYELKDYIGIVILNRPPVNALGKDLVSDISQVCDLINEEINNKKVRAVIFKGEGKHFCAGADLQEREKMTVDEIEPTVRNLRNAINKVGNISVPTIAVISGSAMGGGLELALACDIRILGESAKVGLREVALGIIPGAGGTQRLPKIIGYSKAVLWICTARIFSAKESLEYGVADFLYEDKNIYTKALELATEISKNGPVAVRQAKKSIKLSYDYDTKKGLEEEFECYKVIIPTKDRVEGLRAFIEKREPKYSGE